MLSVEPDRRAWHLVGATTGDRYRRFSASARTGVRSERLAVESEDMPEDMGLGFKNACGPANHIDGWKSGMTMLIQAR